MQFDERDESTITAVVSIAIRAADYESKLCEIVRLMSPNAHTKPTEREVADLIASARETLAQNGITP